MNHQAQIQYTISFYEYLRYFMPGFVFVSLIMLLYKDFRLNNYDIVLTLIISLIIGFPINSFGPYKYIPGVNSLRKEFHNRLVNIIFNNTHKEIPFVLRVYMAWDISSLSMNSMEYSITRRYFGLGTLKLDMAFFLLLSIPILFLKLFINTNLFYLISIIALIYLALILIDDGKNDLVRAYNMILIISNKNIQQIKIYRDNIVHKYILTYTRRRLYRKLL